MPRSWYLVIYDVRDDRRLRLTARLLEGYGERVQYSVFRCRLSRTELARMTWELGLCLAPEDARLVVPLCSRCAANVEDSARRQWGDPPADRTIE